MAEVKLNDASDIVTVIPMTNEALQAVTTPFLAFEHSFRDRPGRYARQIEASLLNTAVVVLSDTWPDSYYAPIGWQDNVALLSAFGKPADLHGRRMWPETALYKTAIAQLFEIDEQIKYRPQAAFLGQLRDMCNEATWMNDLEVSPEAAIAVDDRGVYPLDSAPFVPLADVRTAVSVLVPLTRGSESIHALSQLFAAQKEPLEVIYVLCDADASILQTVDLKSAQVVEASNMPIGAALNLALTHAHGTRIALQYPCQLCIPSRFRQQRELGVDLAMSMVRVSDGQQCLQYLPHHDTHGAAEVTAAGGTMMVHRHIFERCGGFHPDLHVGYDYELCLRVSEVPEFSIGFDKRHLLAQSKPYFPYGTTYSQTVFNDIADRRRVRSGFHGWVVHTRQ